VAIECQDNDQEHKLKQLIASVQAKVNGEPVKAVMTALSHFLMCSAVSAPSSSSTASKRIALAVMRIQPLHSGHYSLLKLMLKDNDELVVVLGSAQEHGTLTNPFTPEQRKKMVELLTSPTDKVHVTSVSDLGPVSKEKWCSYVLDSVKQAGFPNPTHYYAGSMSDADWYAASTMIPIILDRTGDNISATAVRRSILAKTNEWKTLVPEKLIGFIEKEFPQNLFAIGSELDKQKEEHEKTLLAKANL